MLVGLAVTDVLVLISVEKRVGVVVVVVYKNPVFVEIPSICVFCNIVEEGVCFPRLLPFITIDECMLGVDVVVSAEIGLEVLSEEEIATDSDSFMFVVTDVLI